MPSIVRREQSTMVHGIMHAMKVETNILARGTIDDKAAKLTIVSNGFWSNFHRPCSPASAPGIGFDWADEWGIERPSNS